MISANNLDTWQVIADAGQQYVSSVERPDILLEIVRQNQLSQTIVGIIVVIPDLEINVAQSAVGRVMLRGNVKKYGGGF